MDYDDAAKRFVAWVRKTYGPLRAVGTGIELGATSVDRQQIGNVVERWAEAEGVALAPGDREEITPRAIQLAGTT